MNNEVTLKYDLQEKLIDASFGGGQQPFLIVEGKDDFQIYENILEEIGKSDDILVYQVNQFENYTAGCDSVIKCINTIQSTINSHPELEKYVLGIIDRDVRLYRPLKNNDIDYTQLKCLFILDYYSIETYFATRSNLKRLIAKYTYTTTKYITDDVLDFVEENVKNSLENLYYISLETLKNACEENYEAVIGYKFFKGKVYGVEKVIKTNSQQYLLNLIFPKRETLDSFAQQKQLTSDDIKLIAKGKWYLRNYAYRANNNINQLSQKCQAKLITMCNSCKVGNFQDCLYKVKNAKRRAEDIHNDLLSFIDKESLASIIQRIQLLGN